MGREDRCQSLFKQKEMISILQMQNDNVNEIGRPLFPLIYNCDTIID